jgi:hypothetical protein
MFDYTEIRRISGGKKELVTERQRKWHNEVHHNLNFPPRRPGFKPVSGHVGFCDGQKWR